MRNSGKAARAARIMIFLAVLNEAIAFVPPCYMSQRKPPKSKPTNMIDGKDSRDFSSYTEYGLIGGE